MYLQQFKVFISFILHDHSYYLLSILNNFKNTLPKKKKISIIEKQSYINIISIILIKIKKIVTIINKYSSQSGNL